MTRHPRILDLSVLATMLIAGAPQLLAGQQSSQPKQQPEAESSVPVIQANVRRVLLDVVVTGPNGEPVRGLIKSDFTVLEDGKPQTIRSFDVCSLDLPMFVPLKLPPMPPNTYLDLPREPERGPLYLLLYDMVNTDIADQPYARAQLLKFIQNKPAGTRFAIIVLSDGMHLVQGFTQDKDQLLAVLDAHSNHPHVPMIFLMGRNFGNGDPGFAMSVFSQLAHYLEGFPGRKNLIWLSGKFPLSLFANFDNPVMGDGDYTDKVKDIVDTLARDQIAIYPIDAQGAVVTEAYAPSQAAGPGTGVYYDYHTASQAQGNPVSAPSNGGAGSNTGGSGAAAAGAVASGPPHDSGGPGYSITSAQYMSEDELARQTGGHAYYSRNDLAAALATATINGADYYTLSYSPTNQVYKGKLRVIELKLRQKGYHLSYRRSYFGVDHEPLLPVAVSPAAPAVELVGASGSIPQDDPLSTEMRHGSPMAHDVTFRAQFHALGTPTLATQERMSLLIQDPGALRRTKKNKPANPQKPVLLQSYTVDYRVLYDSQQLEAPHSVATFEFVAASFDADGNMLSGVLQDSTGGARANPRTAKRPGFLNAQQQLDVPLKAVWIRVAVRNLSTNRVGTLEIRLPLVPIQETSAMTSSPAPR